MSSLAKLLRSGVVFGICVWSLMPFQVSQLTAQHHDHQHNNRNHLEDWPDSLAVVTVSGTARVDSSVFHFRYLLDENNDGSSDYQLGFGPFWYEPPSGAARPSDGEAITIKGGLVTQHIPPLIIVFEINGLVWRDSTGAPPWSGRWVHRNAPDTTLVFCPTDSLDWIGYPPQSMHGMMFPDSIFCQFEEVHPDSLPGMIDSTMFEGYYSEIIRDHGRHMRGRMMMSFNRDISIQFHYDENELHRRGFAEESMHLMFFDDDQTWKTLAATINTGANTVQVNASSLSTYYALSASPVTSVDDSSPLAPAEFTLFPNFPNPFNPQTTIRYQLKQDADIRLSIFDITGREVRLLFSGRQRAGDHSAIWDGADNSGKIVASGIYFVKLQDGKRNSLVQKMTMVK